MAVPIEEFASLRADAGAGHAYRIRAPSSRSSRCEYRYNAERGHDDCIHTPSSFCDAERSHDHGARAATATTSCCECRCAAERSHGHGTRAPSSFHATERGGIGC